MMLFCQRDPVNLSPELIFAIVIYLFVKEFLDQWRANRVTKAAKDAADKAEEVAQAAKAVKATLEQTTAAKVHAVESVAAKVEIAAAKVDAVKDALLAKDRNGA